MKNLRNIGAIWVLGVLLALTAPAALAQVLPTNPNGTVVNPAAPIVRPDTATVRKVTKKQKLEQAAADSARRTEKLFGRHVTRAEKAGFLAIIPGGGQIYNKKYWKLPIVYGLVGGLGYWIVYQQRYYSNFRFANSAVDSAAINRGPISDKNLRDMLALAKVNNPAAITNGLVSARRFRDLSLLLSAVGYSLTVLDAVVDAHLSDFNVSDDLSLHWQPAAVPVPGQVALVPGMMLTLHTRK